MSHVHTPHSGSDNLDMFTQEFWDARYRSANRIWSGSPNPHLVARVADLSSGTALDVGGGEGADAIWLASLGWQVTAIDVSTLRPGAIITGKCWARTARRTRNTTEPGPAGGGCKLGRIGPRQALSQAKSAPVALSAMSAR